MKKKNKISASGISASEESYRLAKLIRTGNRELERQLNSKKSKKLR